MFHKIPSLQVIAAFEAVARHKSFSRAADELCVTQSAVSHRIKTLEQHFDTKLLKRGPNVTLTDDGAFLLQAVTRALATLESACVVLARSRRVVKLYTGPAFARSWLVKHLGDFYDQHPDIDVEINATKASCEYVRSGDADIAICYGTPPDWPGLLHTEIVRSEVFPVCSPKYLHASDLGDTPDALVSETLLRTPKQPWTPWFRAAGLDAREPDHGPFFSDAALMLDAAAQGQGIALARKVLVEHELAAHRLVRVSSIGIQAEFSYCAVYNPLAALRDEVAVFIDWIEACSEIRRSAPRVADLSAHSAL